MKRIFSIGLTLLSTSPSGSAGKQQWRVMFLSLKRINWSIDEFESGRVRGQ